MPRGKMCSLFVAHELCSIPSIFLKHFMQIFSLMNFIICISVIFNLLHDWSLVFIIKPLHALYKYIIRPLKYQYQI